MNENNCFSKSGDELLFKSSPKGIVVVKTQTTSQGERLLCQAKKQKKYNKFIHDSKYLHYLISIPNVISIQKKKQSCSFEMEYFYGDNIIEFFEKRDIGRIQKVSKSLYCYLDWEFSQSNLTNAWYSPTKKKLEDLKTKISSDIIDDYSFCFLLEMLNSMKHVPLHGGMCHGDLTFSNMIFTDKIILFDFLPVFFDTPLQDIAKLLQEVRLRWTYLIADNITDKAKVEIAYIFLKKNIDMIIQDVIKIYKIDYVLILIFYLIAIIRILPYLKSPKVVSEIQKEVKSTIEQIKEIRYEK
jgi:thiamine kinase-like enzyme